MEVWGFVMDEKFSVIQFSVFSKKSQGDCREETQGEKVSSGSVFSLQPELAEAGDLSRRQAQAKLDVGCRRRGLNTTH